MASALSLTLQVYEGLNVPPWARIIVLTDMPGLVQSGIGASQLTFYFIYFSFIQVLTYPMLLLRLPILVYGHWSPRWVRLSVE